MSLFIYLLILNKHVAWTCTRDSPQPNPPLPRSEDSMVVSCLHNMGKKSDWRAVYVQPK